MSRILVERSFEAPLQDADLQGVMDRMGKCLDLYGVQWVRSFLSDDRCRMICEFEAPDTQAVREVQREAQAPYDKAWVAQVLEA